MFGYDSATSNLSAPTTSMVGNTLRVVEPPFSLKIFRSFSSAGPSAPKNVRSSKTYFEAAGIFTDNIPRYYSEVERFLETVTTLISNWDRDGATKVTQANYEVVKTRMVYGVKGFEEITFIGVIAICYFSLGNKKTVRAIAAELEEIVDGLSDSEPRILSALLVLEPVLFVLEKFEKLTALYQRHINIMEKLGGKNNAGLAQLYGLMAMSLGSAKKATQAIDCYLHAIALCESSEGEESENLITPLSELGDQLFLEGKTKDAETHFLRVLKIHEKLYGKYDGRVRQAIAGLAKVKHAMGDVEETNVWCGKAIQIARDSDSVAKLKHVAVKIIADLTDLLLGVGREEECKEILRELLLAAETIGGKEHSCVVEYMAFLAACHARSKNFAEAEPLLRTCVEIMSKTRMFDNQAFAKQMLCLASSLFHLQRTEEADEFASEALRILEIEFGEESSEYAKAVGHLLFVKFKYPKDDEELLEKFGKLLRIQEKLGLDEEEVMKTLEKMAVLLEKVGRTDEKLAVEERLSTLRSNAGNTL